MKPLPHLTSKNLLPILALGLLAIAQTAIGLRLITSTNFYPEPFDQAAYILMCQKLATSPLPDYTDGIRNPLFPWLISKILNPTNPDFFINGKILNTFLASAGSFLIGVFALPRLGALAAWNLSALSGIGCLIPLSSFLGAEVLFYLVFFGLWIVCFSLLQKPKPLPAILGGILAGLAYLAKPSATPFLILWSLTLLVTGTASAFSHYKNRPLAPGQSLPYHTLICLATFWLASLPIIAPRLIYSQQTFGSPFYNLPSFHFWADNWQHCLEKYTNCTAYGLSQLHPDEHPTPANYFRRNSLNQAWHRLLSGSLTKLQQLFDPDKKPFWKAEKRGQLRTSVLPYRGEILASLGLLAIALKILAKNKQRFMFDENFLSSALVLATIIAYLLAFGWYHVIGPGPRFIMMFHIPLAWSFISTARHAAADSPVAQKFFTAFQVALAATLSWRILEIFTGPNFSKVAHAF